MKKHKHYRRAHKLLDIFFFTKILLKQDTSISELYFSHLEILDWLKNSISKTF